MARNNNTKRLTVCAMLSALSVILLYVGSLVEVADFSMAVIASLACVFAVIEYGKSAPWLVFFVTAVLSLVLLPNKTPAVTYALFFGFYPILKERFERRGGKLCWIFKEIVFNVCLALMVVIFKFLLWTGADIPAELYVIGVVLCEVIFILYDIALTRLISFYVYRLRKKFKL